MAAASNRAVSSRSGSWTGLLSAGLWLLAASGGLLMGCGGGPAAAKGEPVAKQRITQVLRLYMAFLEKNKRPPASEQALREFGQKLTQPQREAYLLGDDLETIFTSPRDNQKFEVRYNVMFSPAQNRAVAWEAKGQNGRRFVALSIGYVEEYDEETLKEYKK